MSTFSIFYTICGEKKTYQEEKNTQEQQPQRRQQQQEEKIMNRLIIQVISLNYLEDKINGFHVIARQRQINHISQHFPFSSCFSPHFFLLLSLHLFLSVSLLSSALENTKTLVVLNLHI